MSPVSHSVMAISAVKKTRLEPSHLIYWQLVVQDSEPTLYQFWDSVVDARPAL